MKRCMKGRIDREGEGTINFVRIAPMGAVARRTFSPSTKSAKLSGYYCLNALDSCCDNPGLFIPPISFLDIIFSDPPSMLCVEIKRAFLLSQKRSSIGTCRYIQKRTEAQDQRRALGSWGRKRGPHVPSRIPNLIIFKSRKFTVVNQKCNI